MSKMIKGALIGGAIGMAAVAVRAYKRDEPVDVMATDSLRSGGQAAAAGAVIGALLGWRDKRKAKKSRKIQRLLGASAAGSGFIEVARVVRPSLEHAYESIIHAADLASPHVHEAAGATKKAAKEGAETAKPYVKNAVKVTGKKAATAAKIAREGVSGATEAARIKGPVAADLAPSKAFEAADIAKLRAIEATKQAGQQVTDRSRHLSNGKWRCFPKSKKRSKLLAKIR